MRVTRGFGLLEGVLAKKRASLANSLIPASLRTDRILDIGCGSIRFFCGTQCLRKNTVWIRRSRTS